MDCYAGIGSREITIAEANKIRIIAGKLSKKFIVYSGNASGSDIAFQKGSRGNCVIYLPWNGFNKEEYNPADSLAYYDVGNTTIGKEYAQKFHPVYSSLGSGAKKLMCRNTHQILGYQEHPRVRFVVFCSTEVDAQVQGGTFQAVRIARSLGIPTFNIRNNETDKLSEYLKGL